MQMDNTAGAIYPFTYSDAQSYSANYNEWCHLNRKERELFGDELLSEAEIKLIFDSQYGANKPGPGGSGV